MKYENSRPPMAVILAADVGARLSSPTDDTPTCLLSVGGSIILERMIRNCLSCGISQFVLVLGHRSDQIKQYVDKTFRGIRVTYVINERYRDTSTGYSLMLASSAIGTAEFIKLDANVVFDTQILRQLRDSDDPNVLCIDRSHGLEDEKLKVIVDDQMRVVAIGKTFDPTTTQVGSIGIEKISAATGPLLFKELKEMMEDPMRAKEGYEASYARLLEKGAKFHTLDIKNLRWISIDTAEDFAAANGMFRSPVTTVSRGQQRALDEAEEKEPYPT